ncbi:MAG: GspE/PulE family protein, partial [Candidatus Falkowbacteria bacterium]|nr:GspE/PulE family protein [Candidatus Falkowbacteria bacterium]
MEISIEKLKQLLVDPGYIKEEAFVLAVSEAQGRKKNVIDLLIGKDLIKDDQIGSLIAEDAGFRFVNLRNEKVDEELLALIPEQVAKTRGVIIFSKDKKKAKVGMLDVTNLETIHLIEKKVGLKVEPYYVTDNDFENALSRYKGNIKLSFNKLLEKYADKKATEEEKDDAVVQIVDSMLLYGYQNKASDIHIEPSENKVLVRFRIDGIMYDELDIPKKLFELMITRIKILSKMRTDEHRAALDGKLKFKAENEEVDVRVSIIPVTDGENVVMRLLSSKSRQYSLTDLGMNEVDLNKVKRNIKNPHGLIIVTGPTGSGKTTTVYAVMKIINTRDVHISTIEDPVEYEIEGISQIQVNSKTDLTFAKGLKAIVRQDPNIIMVGEVRDGETADISVNAAMTGHLVLTTLHANDAATTLPRLIDMNVEPYLVASTVNLIIAQRLVRQICPKCKMSVKMDEDTIKLIDNNSGVKAILAANGHTDLTKLYIYKGKGCALCHNKGIVGRMGIFEVLEMNEVI